MLVDKFEIFHAENTYFMMDIRWKYVNRYNLMLFVLAYFILILTSAHKLPNKAFNSLAFLNNLQPLQNIFLKIHFCK